ncbi:hypothetical protein [Brevundimonas sp.]|jgi:hypothetical protein|uniref:hypothetical protein n=1 Tax=Brevundimonas sp. TaxID=1871086 RepID=UPI003783AD2A
MLKTCTTCKTAKATESFGKKSGAYDGLQSRCKPCIKIADADRFQRTKEICSARKKAWAAANPDKQREMKIRYRKANPEAVKAERKRWRERNPSARHAAEVRRELAIAQRCGLLTPEGAKQIERIYAEARRLTQETGIPHHVDHIAPLRGETISGLHIPENLRIIPAEDNIKKGAKVQHDLIALATMMAWF